MCAHLNQAKLAFIHVSGLIALVGCAESAVDAKATAEATAEATDTAAPPTGDSGTEATDSGADTADTGVDDPPPPTIVPLYSEDTELERALVYTEGDAVITDFSDRGRDRHAREDQFQSYDHWLPHYFDHRTARFRFTDRVASGGGTIDISFVTEWQLSVAEFRAWYNGMGSVAHYSGNYSPRFTITGPGTFDDDHEQVSEDGVQYRYTYTLDHAIALDGTVSALEVGQMMEIEVSQFLQGPPQGRANYYGTTFLYAVGTGGLVPWDTVGDFDDKASEREDSRPIDPAAWLGGTTTLHAEKSDEPDNHFMQMSGMLAGRNAQPFVVGRRIHHTDMTDGTHDESAENPVFTELAGTAGPRYTSHSCDSCHHRNGRAAVPEPGETLTTYVVRVGDAAGEPLDAVGRLLQPQSVGVDSEGSAWLAEWSETDGLRRPVWGFSIDTPAQHSIRIAPQLVGMGLLEAIPESAVLALEDPEDADGDGISGRARRVVDPITGQWRLGRFGWKAATVSVAHQSAAALAGDMGVTTTMVPTLDCGDEQADCGDDSAPELSDARLDELTRYVSLLGIRPQRNHEDPTVVSGQQTFETLGCASCHLPEVETSAYHPLAELRSQTIHPYTDLLLHDMGPGLADSLDEDDATGAEWRTPPLWGIGLGPCVTGGVEGPFQDQVCTPHESYLHDGRARTLDEAIRWHGGEAQAVTEAYLALEEDDQQTLIAFLKSL